MAKRKAYRWRGFGEQARKPQKRSQNRKSAPPLRNGEHPMTGPQKTYLRNLCRRFGEPFDEGLTKAQASAQIDRLSRR